MSETGSILELAVRMAHDAGRLQRERYETDFQVDTKSSDVDLVTEVDHACEALLIETLERERPRDSILAEESGSRPRPDAEWRWVIDPLDGTTNFAHGYPCFCVSIAAEQHGEAKVGVVYNPILDELYHAEAGCGAFRNGKPIRVSRERELGRSLVATGFAYDRRASEQDNLAEVAALLKHARALRRDGSAALDLCAVASGRFEAYWEFKLNPWDVAAGNLIVCEAGGRTSDLEGGPAPASGDVVVASNGPVHEAVLEALRFARRA